MDFSTKNKTLIIAGVLILALIVFFVGLDSKKEFGQKNQVSPTWDTTPRKNIEVPEENAENVPENVAIPVVSEAKIVNEESRVRIFDTTAVNNTFTPDTFVINENDTILIRITAVDRDYDFVQPDYKLKQTILKGETKKVGFQGYAVGEFTFFCEICGGLEKGATGSVIIKPKE